jgi:calcineurin-like phosphoesterase family protein
MKPKQIFFSSDLHFCHEKVLSFCDRHYKTIGDMNAGYIKKINSKVKPGDLLYLLGDIVWSTGDYKIIEKINCNVIVIIGNHDREPNRLWKCSNVLVVLQEAIIKVGQHHVRLSHYPYKYGFWKSLKANIKLFLSRGKWVDQKRYSKNPHDDGKWILFGHTHQTDRVRGKSIHVGVDSWDGYPVSLQQVQNIIDNHIE